jgi:hypothetical protein
MKVKVRPLRKEGRLLVSSDNTLQMPKFAGVLTVDEKKDHVSGRTLARARLTGVSTGTEADLLPELMDVRLLWAKDDKLRMTGFERVGNAEYAQTWSVEVTAC